MVIVTLVVLSGIRQSVGFLAASGPLGAFAEATGDAPLGGGWVTTAVGDGVGDAALPQLDTTRAVATSSALRHLLRMRNSSSAGRA